MPAFWAVIFCELRLSSDHNNVMKFVSKGGKKQQLSTIFPPGLKYSFSKITIGKLNEKSMLSQMFLWSFCKLPNPARSHGKGDKGKTYELEQDIGIWQRGMEYINYNWASELAKIWWESETLFRPMAIQVFYWDTFKHAQYQSNLYNTAKVILQGFLALGMFQLSKTQLTACVHDWN